MKTKRLYTAFTITLAIIFAISMKASAALAVSNEITPLASELTIEEINLETARVFNFEEEAYIDDIPFNTECVSKYCLYQKAILEDFRFEDENYIEDIPFNTAQITENASLQTENHLFQFDEEAYIDDIPFDTYTLANKHDCSRLVQNR